MRIALIAYHFRPDEAVGSIRPENWANWLSEEHEVHVVTRAASAPVDDSDAAYRIARTRSLPISLIESLNSWRKKARTASPPTPGNAKPGDNEQKTSSGALVYRMPCLHDFWLPSAYAELKRIRPELIIATHSPYIGIVTALLYCLNHPGTRLWLDFRDLWSGNHISTGLPLFSKFERYLEQKALHRAAVISTVSQGLQAELDLAIGQPRTQLIYNCPARLEKSTAAAPRPDRVPLTLCYTGTIYNGWRDPSPLLQRLVELQNSGRIAPDSVRFCVASKNPGNLHAISCQIGADSLVDFRGALSRGEAVDLQLHSDILVLLESSSPEARGVLTGKIFEYLATSKPILLIGPDEHSELHKLLKKHDRLLSLDDLEAIVTGARPVPVQQSVDYSEISRGQMLNAIRSLDATPKDSPACCQTSRA